LAAARALGADRGPAARQQRAVLRRRRRERARLPRGGSPGRRRRARLGRAAHAGPCGRPLRLAARVARVHVSRWRPRTRARPAALPAGALHALERGARAAPRRVRRVRRARFGRVAVQGHGLHARGRRALAVLGELPLLMRSSASLIVLALSGCLASLAAHAQRLPSGTLPQGGVPRQLKDAQGNSIPLPGIGLPQFSGGIHSLTIDQATPKATRAWIDWNTFSIAADSRVDFVQADAGYSIINRVVGSNGSVMRSLIEGQITAKGSVLLLNQNGILFDRGSQVNVGSFFASTLAINEIAGKNFL